VPIPQILSPGNRVLHDFFEEAHLISSYLLAALVVVHIAGSLRHHFIKRNAVMRRMWFGSAGDTRQAGAATSAPAKSLGS
jgi:cytochrome b561